MKFMGNYGYPYGKDFALIGCNRGYSALGDYATAKKNLDKIDVSELNDITKTVYYQQLFHYYIAMRVLDEAAEALETMSVALQDSRTHKKFYSMWHPAYAQGLSLLHMERGHYGGAESIFLLAFYGANKNNYYARASAKYTLGEIYRHEGRMGKAREAFAYVVEHGNKLYIVEKAKQSLEELAKEEGCVLPDK